MNIFKNKLKKKKEKEQVAESEHEFGDEINAAVDADNSISPVNLDEKEQKLIDESTVADDPATDEMPSANSKRREGGNKKKLQIVLIGMVGFVLVLIGLGTAVARYQSQKEAKRIEEAEKTAQEQKQLATGTVDITDDQERIANENFKDLPPPAGINDPLATDPMADPMVANNPPPPPVSTYQEPTYIEPVNPTPRYSEPISTPYTPPPPVIQDSGSNMGSFFSGMQSAPEPQNIESEIVLEPPPKGADSNVLIDVNALRAGRASAVSQDKKESKVGGNLTPTVLANSSAGRRGDKSFMLLRGATIPCVLKTKIDSTYQGFTVCQLTRDVYSSNGKTLLLERGSQVFGEQNVDINQGQARVAVLWSRVETPKGVVVSLDSPAVGQLGEMGIDAKVNTHFWKRFGGAIMLSVIQDTISVARSRLEGKEDNTGNNNTTIKNTESTASSMAEEALRHTINIPPTATVNAGTVINIMVVRDVDFADVYKLQKR
ncbi:type IV secretion system protein VirB10 [Moraxella lincolnii]|uniref:type IV secretion system protein VirB10 n=1 Tax=Lwoffella lincolnii TaxID=90241 RepID=UPI00398408AF